MTSTLTIGLQDIDNTPKNQSEALHLERQAQTATKNIPSESWTEMIRKALNGKIDIKIP